MDAMDFDFDEDNDLSSALGTETLAARDMVPEGFDNTPRARVPTEQLIQGRRYLKVDQSANKRNGSKVSKIWQHGGERRRIDDGTMDRYWRCGHCDNKRILKCPETGRGATSYPIRHLKNRHFIDPQRRPPSSHASTAGPKICILRSQTHSFPTLYLWLYLPNAEMTLDLFQRGQAVDKPRLGN